MSDYIPAGLKACVVSFLAGAEDEEAVTDVFRFAKAVNLAGLEKRMKALVLRLLQEFGGKVTSAILAGEVVDLALFSKALEADMARMMGIIATEAALRMAADLRVAIDPAVINEAATAWARTYSFDLVKGITETTRKVIASAVESFMNTPGMTRGELVELLAPAFGEYRAEMIAVTEVTRAASQATNSYQKLLGELGLEFQRIWLTNNDDLVCPICGPLHQQPEKMWGDDYPEGPPAHVNCRCALSLDFVGPK